MANQHLCKDAPNCYDDDKDHWSNFNHSNQSKPLCKNILTKTGCTMKHHLHLKKYHHPIENNKNVANNRIKQDDEINCIHLHKHKFCTNCQKCSQLCANCNYQIDNFCGNCGTTLIPH